VFVFVLHVVSLSVHIYIYIYCIVVVCFLICAHIYIYIYILCVAVLGPPSVGDGSRFWGHLRWAMARGSDATFGGRLLAVLRPPSWAIACGSVMRVWMLRQQPSVGDCPRSLYPRGGFTNRGGLAHNASSAVAP